METPLVYYISLLRKDFVEFGNQHLHSIGLSQGLLFLILYIHRHSGCTPGELGKNLGIDAGQATRSLDKLEKEGFIERTRKTEDKRSFSLFLTTKGEKAFSYSTEILHNWEKNITTALNEEEKDSLFHLLTLLLQGANHAHEHSYIY